uniref:Helicase C-terminal domain-containing protein n=1 Tax=Heterorhabditis bacteriophora TaxID=37862 RepID=A0A1I7WC23_HETBA
MHTPNHLEVMCSILNIGCSHFYILIGKMMKDTLSLGTKVLKGLYVLKVSCLKPLNLPNRIKRIELGNQDKNGYFLCLTSFFYLLLSRAPKERSQSLMDFKEKKIPFLICTDVAARGIDVHGVPFGKMF